MPELINNLCEDLKERMKHLPGAKEDNYIIDVIKLLAWFQHKFVFIHPFQDYNGRTARMLTIFLLLKFGLPPSEIEVEKEDDRMRYIEAMKKGDDGDLTQLEKIISESLSEELKLS